MKNFKKTKKTVAILMSVGLCLSNVAPMQAYACDMCGEDQVGNIIIEDEGWNLDDNGCLRITGKVYTKFGAPWKEYSQDIKKVIAGKDASIDSGYELFKDYTNLVSVDFMYLDTTDVYTIDYMFSGCTNLQYVNLKFFESENLVNYRKVFEGANNIIDLEINTQLIWKTDLAQQIGMIGKSESETFMKWYVKETGILKPTAYDIRQIATERSEVSLARYDKYDKIEVSANDSAAGIVSTDCLVAKEGDIVTLSATPNAGYLHTGWESSDVEISENNTFVMPSIDKTRTAVNVVANFEECHYHNITVEVNSPIVAKQVKPTIDVNPAYQTQKVNISTDESLIVEDDNRITCYSFKDWSANFYNLEFENKNNPATSFKMMDEDGLQIKANYEVSWYIEKGSKCLCLENAVHSKNYEQAWEKYEDLIEYVRTEKGASIDSCENLFSNCNNLKEVDLSKLDTSKVTDMSGMFAQCGQLEKVTFGNVDTSKVTDMTFMFMDCAKLKEVDLGGFDTENVENMSNMFRNCASIEAIDLSSFDTSKVITMANMFNGCEKVKSLDLSNFSCDALQQYGTSSLLKDCINLSNISVNDKLMKTTLPSDILRVHPQWVDTLNNQSYASQEDFESLAGKAELVKGYSINTEVEGNGSVISSADNSIAAYGSEVKLTAAPETGYYFVGWESDDVEIVDDTFVMPEKNITIKAVFAEDESKKITTIGSVKSFGNDSDEVTIQLIDKNDNEVKYETKVVGLAANYKFENIEMGEYTMQVSKKNHVTRTYDVVVDEKTTKLPNAQINLLGDITGDGDINMNDLVLLNGYINGNVDYLTNYQIACADINKDNTVNITDMTLLKMHIDGIKPIWE